MLGLVGDPAAGVGHPQLDTVMLKQRGHRRVLAPVERPLVLPDHDLSRSKIGFGWWACRHSVPQAAYVYSLIRPLRTGLRRICRVSRSVLTRRGTSGLSSGARWAMPWCGRAVS